MSALHVRLRLRRGGFLLDIDHEFPARGVSTVFGPSGSGKSTLLRCVAGLERGAEGTVRWGSEVWQDSRGGRFVQPHRRSVGYVFQEPGLFAHLSVRGNLEYAYRRAAERRIQWAEAVGWLGLEPLLDREPGGLSGGEGQRVAIARALLSSPRLLLMDEPLSALDEVSRREILPYIEALPRRLSIPILYVSHSLREVLRVGDHMVWIAAGQVRASGAPAAVVRDAGFAAWQGEEAGVVIDAVVREHDEPHSLTRLDGPWGPMWIRRHPKPPGERVRVQVRASDVSLSLDPEERSSILNQFALGVLATGEGEAGEVLVTLGAGLDQPVLLARITSLSCERLGIAPGVKVFARVKSVAVVE